MAKTAHPSVVDERRDLVTMLEGLTDEQWSALSLCAGWRTREVVAHLTMPYRYSLPRIALEMIKARGNVNTMADRCAHADTRRLTDQQLLTDLRENIAHPWQPPGGGYVGALSHDVIHGQDITVALGIDRPVPDDRMTIVLDSLRPRNVEFFGVDLDGVQLRADDRDWTYGSGSPVRGRAQHLLLVLCGRKLPPGLLRGEQSGRFTSLDRRG